ncbi:GntR family transcriptional regulator [Actinomadura sp. LD22]|uniref:GntR family transcriptional regulator n=1 Tax=Actinomadura physcomitrii TaxID=2650748 RepID=A0A6I4M6S3_9ACTN|nr:winged helix-turn-helix domain-containing protein [Actinomadura physcomitrii]MWA00045.1 GntR family transcriptional regulator [Actinomadura physcomitrii]
MAEIDHESPLPPYRQIAAWVADQIASGALAPDRPIPSEKTLMQEFEGVARTTVRRAVKYLREQGLIYTVPQRGSYVMGPDGPPPGTVAE